MTQSLKVSGSGMSLAKVNNLSLRQKEQIIEELYRIITGNSTIRAKATSLVLEDSELDSCSLPHRCQNGADGQSR